MRHAKAEAYGADDKSRPLAARGRLDALEAGEWLVTHGIRPGHVVVSSATRTRDTWEAVDESLHTDAEVVYDDALYSAGPQTALDVIRGVPADATTVLVLGHNPTIAYLAHVLDDGSGDDIAFGEMSEGYPTAALTVLEVPGAWADLAEASAHITAFHVGRGGTPPS